MTIDEVIQVPHRRKTAGVRPCRQRRSLAEGPQGPPRGPNRLHLRPGAHGARAAPRGSFAARYTSPPTATSVSPSPRPCWWKDRRPGTSPGGFTERPAASERLNGRRPQASAEMLVPMDSPSLIPLAEEDEVLPGPDNAFRALPAAPAPAHASVVRAGSNARARPVPPAGKRDGAHRSDALPRRALPRLGRHRKYPAAGDDALRSNHAAAARPGRPAP